MTLARNFACLLFACALLLSTGCGRKKVRIAKPAQVGSKETGIASWYGHPYHGRRAANGEIYDMERLTAAHRTLPFETWVEVTNLSNEKSVKVRIQDRGPFVGGRVIDLSRAAAREIDLLGPGVTKVRLTVIKPPSNAPDPVVAVQKQAELYGVQVGAFRERSRAEGVRDEMQSKYGHAQLRERAGSPPVWRVLVGEEETLSAAEELADRIRSSGTSAFAIRLDEPQVR
jgi:rare lipoprotein A